MYINVVNVEMPRTVAFGSSDRRLSGFQGFRAALRRGKLSFVDHAIGDILDLCEDFGGGSMGNASFQN